MKDRRRLDTLVLEVLGLDPKVYLPRIYEGLTTLVRERIELGKMREKRKRARVEKDISKVERQVLAEDRRALDAEGLAGAEVAGGRGDVGTPDTAKNRSITDNSVGRHP